MKILKNAKEENEVLLSVEINADIKTIQKSIKEKAEVEDCVDHLCGCSSRY